MASLARVHHLALTVTDVDRSIPWYVRVLGFAVVSRSHDAEYGLRRAELHAPGDGLSVVLVEHAHAERPPFNERHTGLDHVAFAVASGAELDRWERKLADHGVAYSVAYNAVHRSPGRTVVFRDPDGIQLEILAEVTDTPGPDTSAPAETPGATGTAEPAGAATPADTPGTAEDR